MDSRKASAHPSKGKVLAIRTKVFFNRHIPEGTHTLIKGTVLQESGDDNGDRDRDEDLSSLGMCAGI